KFYSNQEQLNSRDAQGLYPLHHAVTRGDPQIAEILIVLGATPDVTDPAGKTPLRYAVDRGQVASARMLVDRGADPFLADAAGSTSAEAALLAGLDMTAAVFNAKNINASGADGRTALHMAADKLLEKEVALLLDMGASAQTKDKADRSPLDLALLYPDRIEAARIAEKLILRGASPSFPEFAWFATAVRAVDYASVRYSNGNGPLHEAISRYQYGFASFLLSRKVSPNVRNLSGDAPLHFAVRSGWLEGTELLLSGGADPDIRDGKDNTPLHLTVPAAARLRMTKLLLRFKADPSLKDAEGNTALHRAVKQSYEADMVETLISGGAPVNSANLEGDTPLMLAVKAGGYQYADPLIKAGADIFLRNVKGESPLSIAVARGVEAVDKIVLKENVQQRDNSGNGILATAVSLRGSPEVVTLILSKGADPNIRNNAGDGALHIAVRNNLGPQGVILLEAKADVFASNAAQETPLILALTPATGPYDWFFTPQVVAARDANGDSALHYAARKNLPAGIEYLVGMGADIKAVNSAKETTLHAAVKTDAADAARLLISMGIDLASRDSMGDAPLNVAVMWNAEKCLPVLVLSGADLNARNFSGEAAMHQAVRKGNRDALRYLLDRGANKEARDNRGQTPLSAAAIGARADIVQDLLSSGAEVDARENSGKTPLFGAVESGYLELVRLFVKANADILARNAAGDSPLTLAFRKGPAQVRELLTPASVNRGDSEGRAPLRLLVEAHMSVELIDAVLAAGANPDGRDRFAETALHAAIRLGDYATAEKLVQIGCDPFAPNHQGVTPAGLAMDKGADALKALVNATGANAHDVLGNGFLHYAARAGKQQAAEILLQLGADKSMKTISGETAADIAASGNYPTLAAALR
ncbi:MAG: ankyrin repeat domain-containing protein, partial [Rectinema sp.]